MPRVTPRIIRATVGVSVYSPTFYPFCQQKVVIYAVDFSRKIAKLKLLSVKILNKKYMGNKQSAVINKSLLLVSKQLGHSPNRSWLTTHQQFVTYGRNAKEWLRKCQLLLPSIAKYKIWEKKGFKDIYEYAAKLAGMRRDQVDDALWILRKIEDKPALLEVVARKGINAVRPVIPIATVENDLFLAEKADTMPNNVLRLFIKEIRADNLRDITKTQSDEQSNIDQIVSPQVTIGMQLDPMVLDKMVKLKGSSGWNDLMKMFIALHEDKLEQKKPNVIEATARAIPVSIKRHVLAKTNSTCAFPGCQKAYKILHHTNRFAQHHTHDPDHVIPLCVAHERLAHLGLIDNEDLDPQFWKVRARPNCDDPKYEVDRVVEKFRQPQASTSWKSTNMCRR